MTARLRATSVTSAYGRDYRLGYSLGALGGEGTTVELDVDAQREERVAKQTEEENVFQGVTDNGELVATLRFDVQRLFQDELDVIATLSTTPELGEEDDVNTINVRVAGQRIQLRERTAEKIFPSDEVSAVFGNDDARGLIEGPIESVELDLRNVDRWERIGTVAR